MSSPDEKPSFSPTARDALMMYRLLQLGFCTREQIQGCVFGEGESAKVSMSRRWARMKKLDYIREKDGLFYATALGRQKVLIEVLAQQLPEIVMIDQEQVPDGPNPGNARLLFEHYKWIAEGVLHFIERYESLSLVKRLYVLRAPKLWEGRIQPDSGILLVYEQAFSLFFLEVEIDNTQGDFKAKLMKYIRYQNSRGFYKDYEEYFQPQYHLVQAKFPFFRVMVVCSNERQRKAKLKVARSLVQAEANQAEFELDLSRFTVFDLIKDRANPRPIWTRPDDNSKDLWEVE